MHLLSSSALYLQMLKRRGVIMMWQHAMFLERRAETTLQHRQRMVEEHEMVLRMSFSIRRVLSTRASTMSSRVTAQYQLCPDRDKLLDPSTADTAHKQ